MSKNEKQSGAWKLLMAEGIIGALLGVAFIALPGKSVFWLFIFLGLVLLIQGVIGIVRGLVAAGRDSNWPFAVFGGVLSVLFGSMILNWPEQTIIVAIALFGLWAVGSGLVMLVSTLSQRKNGFHWSGMAIALIDLVFGIFLLTKPAPSVAFLMVLNGLFILVVSVLTVIFSLEVKRIEAAK